MTPLAVSLVEEECETPTNYLNIIYNLPTGEKAKFAVCVKGMDFPLDDLSVRMVEWLEVLKALGADKIFLYNLDVHPNVKKVLINNDYIDFEDKSSVTPRYCQITAAEER